MIQTITALGGVGKTQIVLEYAYRYAAEYKYIWWIRTENEFTVLADYKDFALKRKLLSPEEQDSKIIFETVLNWMDNNSDWLFIYDNAEDIDESTRWWPRNNRNHIMITTRNRQIHVGKIMDISLFSKDEAVDFLIKRTEIDDKPNAKLLSKRLGYFPLALEQAAAYIKSNTISYAEYIDLLEEYKLELLDETDDITHYDKSIRATLEISINKIKSEASQQLLNMCAYLAQENIYPEMFMSNPELLPSELKEHFSNKLKNKKIWKELMQYSLLKKQKSDEYSMHRLLQEVIRDRIKEDQSWAKYSLLILLDIYKFSYDDQDSFIRNSTHAEAFVEYTLSYLTDDESQEKMAFLCSEGGSGNRYLGNYPNALEWYQTALDIYEKVLGKEHHSTAVTYNNLAKLYYSQGGYDVAIEYAQKAYDIHFLKLGAEHNNTKKAKKLLNLLKGK